MKEEEKEKGGDADISEGEAVANENEGMADFCIIYLIFKCQQSDI